jgi:hypothetical protein
VGTQFWAQTFLITAVGFLYLFFPPKGGFSVALLTIVSLILLLACSTFLPATWFRATYRISFQDQGFVLPSTLSPQPWLSFEDLTLLVVTLLWVRFCLENHYSTKQRQFLVTSYLLTLGVIAFAKTFQGTIFEQNIPWFIRQAGQFSNRNQSCDLLVLGGVLSFARSVRELLNKKTIGALWIILTLIFMIAIIRYTSRAGFILFLIGQILVLIVTPQTHRQRSIVGAIFFLVAITGLFIFISLGSGLVEKFTYWLHGSESRLPIYQDASAMVFRIPWCGVGLGNFEGVFNTMRVNSLDDRTRNLHPESDWLWATSELGLPFVILLGLFLTTIFRTYFLKGTAPDLTRPGIIVATLFLIHSLFDVGGHRLGTTWSFIYLASLGAFGSSSPTDIKIHPLYMRTMGSLLLLLAVFRIQSMSLHPWMPTRASLARIEQSLPPNIPLTEQKTLLDQGISWAPLDWLLYYKRGLVLLQGPEPSDDSSADFNRALFLEQSSIELPIAIGEACRPTNMPEALVAWKELLRRAGDRREEMFENILYRAGSDEQAHLEIVSLADSDPNLQAIAVYSCKNPQEFAWFLQNLLENNPNLNGIKPNNLQPLFNQWVQIGDLAEFIQTWPLHPEWQSAGWRAYTRALAKTGRYQEGVKLALDMMPAPPLPSPDHLNLNDAALQFQSNPQDPYLGLILYQAQVAFDTKPHAIQTLLTIAKLPNSPQFIQILLARQLLDDNQAQAAWQTLEPLLNDH